MRTVRESWAAFIDRQHQYPSGLVGHLVGERMLRQHAPETAWSVGLLRLRPAARVLELGCGAGRGLALALALAPRGHVTGVDLSPTMLRAAARRNRAAVRGGRLALLRGNIACLPFGEPRFDAVLSVHTFYFWRDPRAVCAQLVRMLAAGGRLVSTFATARRLADGSWEFWDVHRRAETLVRQLGQRDGLAAALVEGPDSRQFNNVALVVDKIS